ncbi:MAG: trehalase family glycosidase, partial [Flammeovirgaceae bacterium]
RISICGRLNLPIKLLDLILNHFSNDQLETSNSAELGNQVKKRWLSLNEKVYRATGKMKEKDDVRNEEGEASGGEYPNQDGFG